MHKHRLKVKRSPFVYQIQVRETDARQQAQEEVAHVSEEDIPVDGSIILPHSRLHHIHIHPGRGIRLA